MRKIHSEYINCWDETENWYGANTSHQLKSHCYTSGVAFVNDVNFEGRVRKYMIVRKSCVKT